MKFSSNRTNYIYVILMGVILSGLLPGLFNTTTFAKEPTEAAINRVDSLFKYGEIDKAESEALSILPRRDINDNERVQLEILLGSIYVAKNDTSGAYQAFQRAIRIRPDITLNANIFSPKILAAFEKAKSEWKPENTYSLSQIKTFEKIDQRNQGYPSGILLPGWGLYRQGKSTEGVIFTLLEAASVVGAVYATIQTNQAHDNYHSATATNANTRWNDYRTWYQTRNALWMAVGSVHAIGWLDLSLGKLPSPYKVNFATAPNGIRFNFLL